MLLGILFATLSCGGGGSAATSNVEGISGNWQITLSRHFLPDVPLVYTGFLLQKGTAVAGSVVLGSNCQGVGPVTGTMDAQTLSLTINQFGQDVSLTGAASTSDTASGEFSTLAGGCTDFPNTGTWSAIRISPLAGAFHGMFTSPNTGTLALSGNLDQGANTGNSNASLTGLITADGAPHFCSYLTTASITGVISGTAISLNFYGPDGTLISQFPAVLARDGKSLTGDAVFQATSSSCTGDTGTFAITFP
jgi:hypothetical protein